MTICIVRDDKPNELHAAKEFEGATVREIAHSLGISGPLSLRSPLFEMHLRPECVPLSEYPELALAKRPEKYPPPEWHLRAGGSEFALFFRVQTQLETEFPRMGVAFLRRELETVKVSDVLARCVSTFGLDCESGRLTMGSDELDARQPAKPFLERAQREDIVFSCALSDAAKKKVNHRLYASNEIITSEQAYISDLSELVEYWEPAIRDAKLFDQQQLKNMFRDIPLIRNSHNVFLESLKGDISFATQFGHKFLNFVQFFKLSATFVSQFKSIDELIKEKSRARSFENKFKEIENNLPAGNGRDFLNYYITPVQRYPRYLILMRELDKVTPVFHPDKPYIALAMEAIESVNKEIDFSSYRMKKLEIMDNLQNYFGTSITINEPGREVIKTTKVRIVKPKSNSGVLILFNDILILAAVSSKKSYQMLVNVQNQNFRFANCRPTPESMMIVFEEKEYVIQFNDYEEKLSWMNEYVKIRKNFFDSINTPNPYVIWSDVEVCDSIPGIMNHDGCSMNGSALFFGGVNVSLSNINTLIRYNFNANTWSTINTSLPPRDSHTMNTLDGVAYICFGHSKKDFYNDCYAFDECQGTWSPIKLNGDTPIGRIGHSCVVYEKKLVFFGGKTKEGELLNDVCILDTQTNTFKQYSKLDNSPSPRMYHSAAVVGNKMVIIGGRSEKSISGDIYLFDLKRFEWSKAPIEIQSRMYHKIISYKNLLIIIGGTGDKDELDILDVNCWKITEIEQYGNIPFGISRFACVQIDQKNILIFGGTDSSTRTPVSSTYLLDISHLAVQKLKHSKKIKCSSESRFILDNKIGKHSSKKDESSQQSTPLTKETKQEDTKLHPKEVQEVQPKQTTSEQPGLFKKLFNHKAKTIQPQSIQKEISKPKQQLKSKEEAPQIEQQNNSNITFKTISNGESLLGRKFDENYMYRMLNIDISNFNQMAKAATRIKAHRLWQTISENENLEEKLNKLERIVSGKKELPPNTKLLLKVFDDVTKTTRIKHISSNDNSESIKQLVAKEINRDALLQINTDQTRTVKLTEESLKVAHENILLEKIHAIILVAL